MTKIKKRCCATYLIGCLMLVVGCSNDMPTMSSVTGVVEFDGKPISGFDHAAVIITPTGGRLAKSVIDPDDGTFKLWTYKKGDGVIVGPAKITVSATVDDPNAKDEKYPGVRSLIPDDFSDRDLSGLTCEVVAGQKNFFRIKISSDGTGSVETD